VHAIVTNVQSSIKVGNVEESWALQVKTKMQVKGVTVTKLLMLRVTASQLQILLH
jgi:hypothetical protein